MVRTQEYPQRESFWLRSNVMSHFSSLPLAPPEFSRIRLIEIYGDAEQEEDEEEEEEEEGEEKFYLLIIASPSLLSIKQTNIRIPREKSTRIGKISQLRSLLPNDQRVAMLLSVYSRRHTPVGILPSHAPVSTHDIAFSSLSLSPSHIVELLLLSKDRVIVQVLVRLVWSGYTACGVSPL